MMARWLEDLAWRRKQQAESEWLRRSDQVS